MAQLESGEFSLWTSYVYALTRISLDPSKGYLIETRLSPLLRQTGSKSYRELLDRVVADSTGALKREVIRSITTNETSFFRDSSPFELLRLKVLPELLTARAKAGGRLTLRIWSAACSTGQEVYSIAIACKETLHDLNKHDVRILGTDISDKVVGQASAGRYTKLELDRGLPPDKVNAYFRPDGTDFKITDPIRALASFRTLNLLEPLSFPSKFDIVFCRNVAIYFAEADKRLLFEAIARVMAVDGYLVIGSTESLTGISTRFEPKRHLRSVYYQLK
ncbi:MAG: protein-glutamate O-methyltransferase CheR [Polyangia bacterium]